MHRRRKVVRHPRFTNAVFQPTGDFAMKTFVLVLTLVAGSMGMGTADARLAGWSCFNWDLNGVNYTICCRDRDGYCTGVYAG
jgi:hypothetical protein